MKMKVVCTLLLLVSVVLSILFPRLAFVFPFAIAGAFAVYGVANSVASRLDSLNDLPNAFRVFLACTGGYLITLDRVFIFPSLGIMLYFASLFLNDEYQRLVVHSVTHGRKGGSVALLGIDGSGKSTHAEASGGWLRGRGYLVTTMPFHRYLFVERLASLSSSARGRSASGSAATRGRRSGRNPIRPLLSLADNLILQVWSSIGSRAEGRVVIYDRFIWSTYIKYEALGYPVRPLSFLYLLPKPLTAIILDVPVDKSLKVIDERGASHIHYPRAVLEAERARYLGIARRNGYPVIDATAPFEKVQGEIELHLSRLFPQVGAVGSP
jgi:thymidylate kinase